MKFKQLTIHNIASIADATIHFDQKPLADESLFLICGETGSGKSTILDAICLALYKTTPRIRQSKSEKYVDESLQIIKNGENEGIQVSDPRQYLRRGTREGFVSLSFTGNNGENCTARIGFGIVGRSQNLKPAEWTLEVDRVTITKDKDIRPKIVDTVGFDFEQFCRTTMLAQGEFTRFLKSDEKEKSDILEKLTGTEIYSEIGKRIYEQTKEKEIQKKNAGIALETINLLDDEALNGLREQRLQAEAQSKEKEAERKGLEKKKQWLEKENELFAAVQKAIQEVGDWESKNIENQVVEDRKIVAQWHRTEKERQAVAALRKLKQQDSMNRAENQRLEKIFKRLISGELFRNNEIEAKQKEISNLSAQLEAEQQYAAMYAESQLIIAKLGQHLDDAAKAKQYLAKTKEEEAKQPELEKTWQQRRTHLEEVGKALTEKESLVKSKQEELNQLNPRQLNHDYLKISEELRLVEDAENKLKNHNQAVKDLEESKIRVAEMEKTIQEKTTELEMLKPQIVEAQLVYDTAKNLYEKTKLSVGDYAKALRHELQAGDVCPVCGNTIASLEHDEVLEQALKPLFEDFKNKESRLNELNDNKKSIEADIKSQQNNVVTAKKEEQKKSEVLQAARAEVEKSCETLNIELDFNNLESIFIEMKGDKTFRLESLTKDLEIVQFKQQEINDLNKEKDELSAQEKRAKDAVSEAEKSLSELKANIKHFKGLASQKQRESEQVLKEVNDKISYPDWQGDIKQTMLRLKADSERFGQWQKQKEQLESQNEKAKMAQNLARKTCGRVKNLFSAWEISREACPITDLDSAWGKLLEEATQLHGNSTNVQNQITENKQIIDSFLTSETELDISHLSALSDLSHSQIKDKEDVLNGIEKGLQTAKGALAQVKQNHESHRSDKPEIGEEDTLENLVIQIDAIKETLMVLARQMGEVDSQIKANDSRREDYNRQKAAFEQAEKEWLKWDSLCKIFGDKEGKTFRVIAQSYVLRELLAHANTFLRNFSDRYELVCQNSLTILVRDLYYGGMARPVDLVSGGESFIVSLALALGLSSLNRNSLSADILFIDEGFGTLDPTVLEVVMNTLGRLQALGDRRVGVISHVEALRERIPVKILVEKIDNTTSRVCQA